MLEGIEVFASIDEAGFERLENVGATVSFPQGATILQEGEPGDAFFVVLSGLAEIETKDFAEATTAIAQLGPGRLFGEGAALTGEPRAATVTAAEDVKALRFEMVSVFGILKDYPEALNALRRLAVDRAEDLLERVKDS